MLFKATAEQTVFMLKTRKAVCVFCILLFMVIANFIGNVLYFQGEDIVEMVHPMRLVLLSYDRTNLNASNTLLLTMLYPILVVCPTGFSLAQEQQLGVQVYFVARQGRTAYYISKFMSAFLATMIVFTVPFLVEILLNCLSFPLSATGNMTHMSIYDYEYIDAVNQYWMKNFYFISPYLYTIIGTLLFGIISGLLGCFTVAVSALIRVKYNVLLFLPVCIALNLSTILSSRLLKGTSSIKWYDYILLFNDEIKNTGFGIAIILFLIIFPVIVFFVNVRKDCLQ